MKILASINYGRGISKPLLQSLVGSRLVSKLIVVSDLAVLQIPGVKWYSTPKYLKSPMYKVTFRGILRVVTHLLFMLYLTVRKKPDIIIGFHIFPQCVYAFICAKLFRKPVIACIGDWPGIWRIRRILLYLLRHCNLVTTTGSITREYLIKQGVEQERIYARPDPTDTQVYKPSDSPKIYDLIFVGRLSPEKNVGALLKVIDQVRRVKTDLRAGIIGDGYLRESLQQMSMNLGITNYVEFLGYKENPEYYCNSSKILILTSLHEGLPRAMVEAMACCTPCVVPDVGDITDAAIDGFNALVIKDPHDVQSYTNAIIRLLDNADLYYTLSKNARIIAEKKYGLSSATEAWDRILNLLGQNRIV